MAKNTTGTTEKSENSYTQKTENRAAVRSAENSAKSSAKNRTGASDKNAEEDRQTENGYTSNRRAEDCGGSDRAEEKY